MICYYSYRESICKPWDYITSYLLQIVHCCCLTWDFSQLFTNTRFTLKHSRWLGKTKILVQILTSFITVQWVHWLWNWWIWRLNIWQGPGFLTRNILQNEWTPLAWELNLVKSHVSQSEIGRENLDSPLCRKQTRVCLQLYEYMNSTPWDLLCHSVRCLWCILIHSLDLRLADGHTATHTVIKR